MSIRVHIRPGCTGMGSCTRLAPTVFRMAPGATVPDVLVDDATPFREGVLAAAKSCPFVGVEIDGVPVEDTFTPVAIVSHKLLTPDVLELRLRRPGFAYIPGQYVFVRLRDQAGEFFRAYSVADHTDQVITLGIRLVANGRAGTVLRALGAGDQVSLGEAKGLFALQPTLRPKLFVGGGTGIAPILAMCRALPPEVRKRVVFGVRSVTDRFWEAELSAIPGVDLLVVIQNPDPSWNGATGLVTNHLGNDPAQDYGEVYLCGAPGMINGVTQALIAKGFSQDRIFADVFAPAGTNSSPSRPQASPGGGAAAPLPTDWPGLLRRIHLYTSVPLALVILFYAITGFIANRAEWFNTGALEKTIPAGITIDGPSVQAFAAGCLPAGCTAAGVETPTKGPLRVLFSQGDIRWVCEVDPEARVLAIHREGVVPPNQDLATPALITWLGTRIPGQPDHEHQEDAPEKLEISFESVWGVSQVAVDRTARTWRVVDSKPAFAVSLVDLHRGKHSHAWQKVIVDITALVLALVTLTGGAMALLSAARRRQAILLLGGSSLLLFVLLFAR